MNKLQKRAHYSEEKKENLVIRLNRIRGQIEGIAKMIQSDMYCDDVLHQVSSVESALNGFKTVLLESHIRSCIVDQIRDGDDEVIDELLITMRKIF